MSDRRWFLRGLLLAGLLAGARPRTLSADNVTFCYHQFDHSLEGIYSVLPEVFEWQVDYIRHDHLDIIPMKQLVEAYTTTGVSLGTNVVITIDDGWKSVRNILPVIEKDKVPVTLFLYPSVIGTDADYLTWPDIETIKKIAWISFGCHSYDHPIMRREKEATLVQEVVESKSILEKGLGRELDTFAYPFGMFDDRTKKFAGQHYQLIFGVNDGRNTPATDKENLNRFVVYRTTGFGEFIDMLEHARGRHREKGYSVKFLGAGRGDDKYFVYTKVKLYKFPAEKRDQTLLVIPSSGIGGAWIYKWLPPLSAAGLQTYVLVNRNNNLPFYRPYKDMRSLKSWGLQEYREDLKSALDYIDPGEHSLVILTWGDGFDLAMSVLADDGGYRDRIRGIVAVNPSLLVADPSRTALQKNIDEIESQLAKGEFATPDLPYYLKIKTLSDLMLIRPEAQSPYAKVLGYDKPLTNARLFLEELDKEDHPDLSLDVESEHYSFADYKLAFMQPLPVFSMSVPLRWQRDLNDLWLHEFEWPEYKITAKREITVPLTVLVSDAYAPNVARIAATFPKLSMVRTTTYPDLSTVEMLLSNSVTAQATGAILDLFPKSGSTAKPPASEPQPATAHPAGPGPVAQPLPRPAGNP